MSINLNDPELMKHFGTSETRDVDRRQEIQDSKDREAVLRADSKKIQRNLIISGTVTFALVVLRHTLLPFPSLLLWVPILFTLALIIDLTIINPVKIDLEVEEQKIILASMGK